MLLVVDVGNTTTEFALFSGDSLAFRWRISTNRARTMDEYALTISNLLREAGVKPHAIEGAAIACVTPPVLDPLVQALQTKLRVDPLVVSAATETGLSLLYNPPEALGADRLVNAFAATEKHGFPAIVVDLGTATKFEAISARKEYLGGAIAPGVGISMDALFERAAKLPRLDLKSPASAIGTNTVDAMRAGAILGTVGQVDFLIQAIRQEMGSGPAPVVVATGGYANILAGRSREVQIIDPQLTIDGLRLLFERHMQL